MKSTRDDTWQQSEQSPVRSFRLSDAMLLMAALFVAMAWDRERILNPFHGIPGPRPGWALWSVAVGVGNVIELLPPFLTIGSLSVVALRLRKPRPRVSQLSQQPGTIACTVASLAMIAIASATLASHLMTGKSLEVARSRAVADLQPDQLNGVILMISFAVMVTWVVLAAKRRLRPEPGWIDRLGRLLGWGWIAMLPGAIYLSLIRFAYLF